MLQQKRRGRVLAVAIGGLLVIALTGSGCSRDKLVVAAMVPILQDAMDEAYASGDIATIEQAVPAQILLLRGICRSDPDRTETWTAAVQLYGSYAVVFVEPADPERAARLFADGKSMGLEFLKRIDWFGEAWTRGPDSLRAAISAHHPKDLGPLLTWTAACLGMHVLNSLDQPAELADLPYVHVMADAAIELTPAYSWGMPCLMKALMLTLTPAMLGGDLAEADRLFHRAFELTDRRFLLHYVFYARYYCTAMLDEELFGETLRAVLQAPLDLAPETRLINLVARRRAEALLEMQAELF